MTKLDIKDFDKEFISNIEKLSAALGVKPAVFIENIIIRRLAEDQAEDDVYGAGPGIMPEFIEYEGELKRGKELYKILYNLAREQNERERVQQIQESLKYLTFGQLPDDDKELMKRRGLDPESKKLREKEKKEAEELLKKHKDDYGPVEIEWSNNKDKE